MTKKQAIEDSIKHWKRMIRWAKKQPAKKTMNSITMRLAMYHKLHESWIGEYCALCKKFPKCKNCPVAKSYGICGMSAYCPKNSWADVNSSKNWGEWVIAAKQMLEQLKSLKR